jgi:hypothetical protein
MTEEKKRANQSLSTWSNYNDEIGNEMKRIISILFCKDECDIIESFCRYNILYCDLMLIYDSGSSDNTREIIEKLIEERLPIILADSIVEKKISNGMEKEAEMLKLAFDTYQADIVIRLDSDEFLYDLNGKNPRNFLESINDDIEYQIPWRCYLYEKEENLNIQFTPFKFHFYRNPKLEFTRKVILTRYLYKKGLTVSNGCHCLIYGNNPLEKDCVKINIPQNIVYAHFPVRNKYQLMTKVLAGHIHIYQYTEHLGLATHYNDIYNFIKKNGYITDKMMRDYSINFALHNDPGVILNNKDSLFIKGDFQLQFSNIILKYTDIVQNERIFIRTILSEFEETVSRLPEREAEALRLYQDSKREIAFLKKIINQQSLHRIIYRFLRKIFTL